MKHKFDLRAYRPVEAFLVIVLIALVGFVVGFVHHVKDSSDKTLSSDTSGSPVFAVHKPTTITPASAATTLPAGSDNQSLQSDLSSINSSNAQTSKDMDSTNSSLSDTSTFTTVPTN